MSEENPEDLSKSLKKPTKETKFKRNQEFFPKKMLAREEDIYFHCCYRENNNSMKLEDENLSFGTLGKPK